MRKLTLKVTTASELDPKTGDFLPPRPFPYRTQLIGLLKFAPPGAAGVDVEEMAKVIPIINKLRAADDLVEIELEDEEWRLVKGRAEKAQWGSADQAILDFIDDIRKAPSTTLLKKAK